MGITTPVAFFVFNRPDLTQTVFERIRAAKPARLLVIADGPRNKTDVDLCAQTRQIVSDVDWECSVSTLFADANLGCGVRFRTGLEWLFSNVEEAIILEDDCLPDPSFFTYSEHLLDRFRDDERVTSINGCNLGFRRPRAKSSYGFTRFMNMWGWATWRRSFELVDFDMQDWPSFKESAVFEQRLNHDKDWIPYWRAMFDMVHRDADRYWDYHWILANLRSGGAVVTPSTNMVTNLGWRQDATHTGFTNHPLARLDAGEMPLPLVHPDDFEFDLVYEQFIKLLWCGLGWKPTAAETST